MVIHKKHQILNIIRIAILRGDSLQQAKSLCLHNGFSEIEIKETLLIFDEFKHQINFNSENFWHNLTHKIFELAIEDNNFKKCINELENETMVFNLNDISEKQNSLLDRFRLLDICGYSGFNLIIKIPTQFFNEFITSASKVNISQFEEILAKKKKLGLEGELFVINQEQERLGSDYFLEHTSQIDVGAGYDIKSWRNNESYAESNKLFIEVKTFSVIKEIFITQNELATAKRLGKNYRLQIIRKINNHFITYKIIDDLFSYFENNKSDFTIRPTYSLKL